MDNSQANNQASGNVKILKEYIRRLDKDQAIDLFIKYLQKDEPQLKADQKLENITVPISIFNSKLSSLETIVKHLRENLEFSNQKIALMLLKSAQNIWITHRNAKAKMPEMFISKKSVFDIPIKLFADSEYKELSTLEIIVSYLKTNHNLSNKEISLLLKRSLKTITTIVHRIKIKRSK